MMEALFIYQTMWNQHGTQPQVDVLNKPAEN